MSKDRKKDKKETQEEPWWRLILEFVVILLVALGIGQLLTHFVLATEVVQGPSMQATFETGDRVIAYRHSKIERGDIVILKAPDEPGSLYIKRVIGLPGETVTSKNDTMYINGKKLAQPFLKSKYYTEAHELGQLYTSNFTLKSLGIGNGNTVPKGSYFVMGDHRNVSKDSRMIGYIKKDAIIGVVKLRYWPLSDFKTF